MVTKYQPLRTFLESRPGRELPMSFSEVEGVLRFPLPPSARRHAAWWSNNVGTHVGAAAWRSAGWRTSRVDIGSERLVFVRDEASPAKSDDDTIHVPVALLTEAARKLLTRRQDGSGQAAAELINAAATDGRRRLIERFEKTSPALSNDSTVLIRADRDER